MKCLGGKIPRDAFVIRIISQLYPHTVPIFKWLILKYVLFGITLFVF